MCDDRCIVHHAVEWDVDQVVVHYAAAVDVVVTAASFGVRSPICGGHGNGEAIIEARRLVRHRCFFFGFAFGDRVPLKTSTVVARAFPAHCAGVRLLISLQLESGA